VGEACVLDSFAVLTLLGGEPGGEVVARLLWQAQEGEVRLLMTWVNLGSGVSPAGGRSPHSLVTPKRVGAGT
jgi:hypothetical protein